MRETDKEQGEVSIPYHPHIKRAVELADWKLTVRQEFFGLIDVMKSGTMDNASTIQALELLEKLTRG